MSFIYVAEPPTCGKVVLKTTVGDIEIELWTKEAPKACKNFIQLSLSGYYDGCPFHRIAKGFLVQTGDPTGTGTGGQSIYGAPFPNEIHSRLKFRHRGMVAMACDEPNQNNSQFFITLDRCDWLNGQHTIFGKVVGNTIFNVLRIADWSPVDEHERPQEPVYINIEKKQSDVKPQRLQKVAKRKSNLLSFDNNEEQETFLEKPSLVHPKVEIANVPAAVESSLNEKKSPKAMSTKEQHVENIEQSEQTEQHQETQVDYSQTAVIHEYEQLKQKWKQQKNKTMVVSLDSQQKDEEKVIQDAPFMSPVEARRLKYATKRRNANLGNRQEETLKRLQQFRANLRRPTLQSNAEKEDKGWLLHRLQFPQNTKEKDETDHSNDYEVFDPLQGKRGENANIHRS
ncbi:Peptidyl-prolyl cis-trans isomerase CWC27 [Galdieria sulphuraria]|nr:Peptidyl-prolyl cis-trans isomerase CWC27 [Galdieria sulphuraria]